MTNQLHYHQDKRNTGHSIFCLNTRREELKTSSPSVPGLYQPQFSCRDRACTNTESHNAIYVPCSNRRRAVIFCNISTLLRKTIDKAERRISSQLCNIARTDYKTKSLHYVENDWKSMTRFLNSKWKITTLILATHIAANPLILYTHLAALFTPT